MKKNLLPKLTTALLIVGLMACGGSQRESKSFDILDEETVQTINEMMPEDGLLGSIPREIALNLLTIEALKKEIPNKSINEQLFDVIKEDSRFERYAKNQMSETEKSAFEKEMKEKTEGLEEKLTREKEEAVAKWKAADSTFAVRCEELSKELSSKDLPTEIDENAPLKLIQPFRVEELTNRSIMISCVVELEKDLEAITGFEPRTPMPTLNIYNEDNEPYKLESRELSSRSPIKAGTQLTLKRFLHICRPLKDIYPRFYEFANFMRTKKLIIEWNNSKEIKGDNKGDLGIFGLKGSVKECIWKNDARETVYKFAPNGQWTAENNNEPWAYYPQVKRNSSNRIVSMSNGDEGKVFEYNENGLITKRVDQYMDGNTSIYYYYNEDGECIMSKEFYGPGEEGEEDMKVFKYSILERDSHQNWIKRKDQDGIVETRKITYYN